MGLVLLVRHGQASYGADDYDVLSEDGWAQGRRLGRWLRESGIEPDAMYRGELRRHRETAQALLEGGDWTALSPESVAVDAGWDEIDHLSLARGIRLPATHTQKDFQLAFEEWSARWAAGEPGLYDEPFRDFSGRVQGALEQAVSAADEGRTVVVVSSGGPIASVCARLVDPHADDQHHARMWSRITTAFVNTGLTRVLAGDAGPRLLTLNEHTHLDTSEVTYR